MPRPPKRRTVEFLPPVDSFKPAGVPMVDLHEIHLSIDELEAIRLKDREGLDHETCAERMQVSRPTFHRILGSAHQKVAEALTEGMAIRIEGGTFRLTGRHLCRACSHWWHEDPADGTELLCSECGGRDIVRAARGHGHHRRGRGGKHSGRR